jgi:hypothetical protein
MDKLVSVSTKRAQVDVLKFGTMFLASRLMAEGSVTDQAWLKQTMLTLLGFVVFDVVVANVVDLERLSLQDELKDVAGTWLKVGTMLAVSRYLSGGSLSDTEWLRQSAHTLVGFNTFALVTKKVLGDCSGKTGMAKAVCADWAEVTTMMLVSRVLGGQSVADPAWLKESLMTLLGFTAYQVFVAKH